MAKPAAPQIVGVIFSRVDFQRAPRMQDPPDLFELRLDAFAGGIDTIRKGIDKLPAPLILTARHPREGGVNQLSSHRRQELLLAFLPHAAWVDVELRSAPALAPVLRAARAKNIRSIISFHTFRDTPRVARLDEIVRTAQSLGPDLIKIATRTDTLGQLERLFDCFERQAGTTKIVAMGMGKLGRTSRLEFLHRGCVLNYGHLGRPQTAGQLSIRELRQALP
jgi:3-dehydroquinate dehydratase-1